MLAVVINYYSPVKWERPAENYRVMLSAIRRQVPRDCLFPVELHFDRTEPIDPEARLIVGRDCHKYLWQKETIFNQTCRELPARFTKFLMVDADILFDDSEWYSNFSRCLNHYDYAQPFDRAIWQDQNGRPMFAKESCALAPRWPDFKNYHPGFAIGLTRRAFELTDGIYWRSISGANDCLIPWAFFPGGRFDPFRMNERAGEMPEVMRYRQRITDAGLKLGCSLGTIRHLWHGDRKNRQYVSRHEMLNRANYKVTDATLDDQGLFAWTAEDCMARRAMAKYFHRRKEDG